MDSSSNELYKKCMLVLHKVWNKNIHRDRYKAIRDGASVRRCYGSHHLVPVIGWMSSCYLILSYGHTSIFFLRHVQSIFKRNHFSPFNLLHLPSNSPAVIFVFLSTSFSQSILLWPASDLNLCFLLSNF